MRKSGIGLGNAGLAAARPMLGLLRRIDPARCEWIGNQCQGRGRRRYAAAGVCFGATGSLPSPGIVN